MLATRGTTDPQLQRSTQTTHLHCGTRHWQRVVVLNEQILTAKGANTPQPGLLRVPAPPLRANTKSSATIGPATLPIRDPQRRQRTPVNRSHLSSRDICDDTAQIAQHVKLGGWVHKGPRGSHLEGFRPPSGRPRRYLLQEVASRSLLCPCTISQILIQLSIKTWHWDTHPTEQKYSAGTYRVVPLPPGTRHTGTPLLLLAPTRLSGRPCKNSIQLAPFSGSCFKRL